MTIIDRLISDIKASQDQIVAIQKACVHPEPALIRTPDTFYTERFEDDDYGLSVKVRDTHEGHSVTCELCKTRWSQVGDKQFNVIHYNTY